MILLLISSLICWLKVISKYDFFFRNNQYTAPYLTREQRHKAYPLLYYQFIKHAFGFQYSNPENKPQYLKIMLDDIPLKGEDKKEFKNFICGLNNDKGFQKANIKEKLYKYINSKIRELHPGFNIGESTGISQIEERWTLPYSHWSFKPSNYVRDTSKAKK